MSDSFVRGLRAVLVNEPWRDRSDLLLGGIGPREYHAVRVDESGHIVYEEAERQGESLPTLLSLSRDEVDALAAAFLRDARPEDATLDALKDARLTRDRLLTMFEARGIR